MCVCVCVCVCVSDLCVVQDDLVITLRGVWKEENAVYGLDQFLLHHTFDDQRLEQSLIRGTGWEWNTV